MLLAFQLTLYWLLLPEQTVSGPAIVGLGVAVMLTVLLLVVLQLPLAEVKFTEPVPAAPQIIVTLADVAEPLIVPPITLQLYVLAELAV